MGDWGVGPFENDDGADFVAMWGEYLEDIARSWGAEKTFAFFEEIYFQRQLPIVSDGNSKTIIAIAEKFHEVFGFLPKNLKTLAGNALRWELNPSVLANWESNSTKRKKQLLDDANRFEIKEDLSIHIHSESRYSEEIESLNTWFSNLEKINDVRQTLSVEDFDFIDSIKPTFANTIENQTLNSKDDADEDGAALLGNLRYMYLIWMVLFNLGFDSNEIIRLVENERL